MDVCGNPAASIDINNVIVSSTLIENSVILRLLNFTFGGQVTVSLFFSEPVIYSSVDLSQITLLSEQGGTPTVAYNFKDSQVSPVHSSIIRIPIIEADLGEIIARPHLGTSIVLLLWPS